MVTGTGDAHKAVSAASGTERRRGHSTRVFQGWGGGRETEACASRGGCLHDVAQESRNGVLRTKKKDHITSLSLKLPPTAPWGGGGEREGPLEGSSRENGSLSPQLST